MDHRKLRKEYWGRHLWSRGYFVCSSGNVTDEMVEE
jgi:putative transposase